MLAAPFEGLGKRHTIGRKVIYDIWSVIKVITGVKRYIRTAETANEGGNTEDEIPQCRQVCHDSMLAEYLIDDR